jgi:hypothetical protein
MHDQCSACNESGGGDRRGFPVGETNGIALPEADARRQINPGAYAYATPHGDAASEGSGIRGQPDGPNGA